MPPESLYKGTIKAIVFLKEGHFKALVKALAVSFPAVLRIFNACSDDDSAVGRMLSVQIFVPTNGLRMLTYADVCWTYAERSDLCAN